MTIEPSEQSDSETPDYESPDFSQDAAGLSPKPKVLAAWASLKMARELSDFCNSAFETVKSFDFEVVPAAALEGREATPDENRDYSAILLAFSQEDTVSPGAEQYLRSWVTQSVENGERPMIICREGLLNPGDRTKGNPSWNSVVEKLAKEFEADVIWDSRPLFTVTEEAAE